MSFKSPACSASACPLRSCQPLQSMPQTALLCCNLNQKVDADSKASHMLYHTSMFQKMLKQFETCSNLCPYAQRKQFFRCKFLSFWRSPPLEADGALQSVQSVVPVGPSDPRPVPPLPDTKLKNWKTLFTSQIPGELPGVPAPSSSHRKSSNIIWLKIIVVLHCFSKIYILIKLAWSIPF